METQKEVLARKAWQKSWGGLREARGRGCLHWAAKGRCGVDVCREDRNSHWWMDHTSCWLGKDARVLLCQPYHLDADDLRDIVDVAEQHGLEVRITGTGWYGHGTVSVMLVGRN
jgi:hypothetical protein